MVRNMDVSPIVSLQYPSNTMPFEGTMDWGMIMGVPEYPPTTRVSWFFGLSGKIRFRESPNIERKKSESFFVDNSLHPPVNYSNLFQQKNLSYLTIRHVVRKKKKKKKTSSRPNEIRDKSHWAGPNHQASWVSVIGFTPRWVGFYIRPR